MRQPYSRRADLTDVLSVVGWEELELSADYILHPAPQCDSRWEVQQSLSNRPSELA